MNIIVADDDHISRHLLSTLLTKAGNNVVTCSDGGEAMQQLEANEFDMAILDWMMPQTSGIDVCRKLRKAGNNIYIILLTAKSGKTDLVEGLRAGADDYIVKPCDEQELRVRIGTGKRIINLQRQVKGLARSLNSLVDNLSQSTDDSLLSAEVQNMLKSMLQMVNSGDELNEKDDLKHTTNIPAPKRANWQDAALQAITAVDAFKNEEKETSPEAVSALIDTL
jgi:sigma-B regulation protein RsbU (phosphoserine phosphatase)